MIDEEHDEEFLHPSPYVSEEEGSDKENDEPIKGNKKRVNKKWRPKDVFGNPDDALKRVSDEDTWGHRKEYETANGVKHEYRCNKVCSFVI